MGIFQHFAAQLFVWNIPQLAGAGVAREQHGSSSILQPQNEAVVVLANCPHAVLVQLFRAQALQAGRAQPESVPRGQNPVIGVPHRRLFFASAGKGKQPIPHSCVPGVDGGGLHRLDDCRSPAHVVSVAVAGDVGVQLVYPQLLHVLHSLLSIAAVSAVHIGPAPVAAQQDGVHPAIGEEVGLKHRLSLLSPHRGIKNTA